MKGISHFVSGIAAASCFPTALAAAADGNPSYMIMGGFFGLLPDTLDFKFIRYFCRYDVEVAPDTNDPDPDVIANAVVKAVSDAYVFQRKMCIKLHTIRLGADKWLEYCVQVDRTGQKIVVDTGDIIDTGGNVTFRNSERRSAEVQLPCDLVMDYGYKVEVGYIEGPTLLFCPVGSHVESTFIHWHREWSHSLLIACLAFLLCWGLTDLTGGAIAGTALLLHVLMDQAGFMGNCIFFPYTRVRIRGRRLLESGAGFWNFAVVLSSVLLISWNAGLSREIDTGFMTYMFWGSLVPLLTLKNIWSK